MEREKFDGERPVTWVTVSDRLWWRLSDRWHNAQKLLEKDGRLKKGKATRPPTNFWSKHVNSDGPGWMFPTMWVEELEMRDRQDGVRRFYYGERE